MPEVAWTPALLEDVALELFGEKRLSWSEIAKQLKLLYPTVTDEALSPIKEDWARRIQGMTRAAGTYADMPKDESNPQNVEWGTAVSSLWQTSKETFPETVQKELKDVQQASLILESLYALKDQEGTETPLEEDDLLLLDGAIEKVTQFLQKETGEVAGQQPVTAAKCPYCTVEFPQWSEYNDHRKTHTKASKTAADKEKKLPQLSNKVVTKMIPMFVDETEPSDHKCGGCAMFIGSKGQCTIVQGAISGDKGSCSYWAPGEGKATEEDVHEARMDYTVAGYGEAPDASFPINCGTCQYFAEGVCKLWMGKVKAEQCCMAYASSEVKAPAQAEMPPTENALTTESESKNKDHAMTALRAASTYLHKSLQEAKEDSEKETYGVAMEKVKEVMNEVGPLGTVAAAFPSVCEKCKKPFEAKLNDSTVPVGNESRTDTVPSRYCQECQDIFLSELRGTPSK